MTAWPDPEIPTLPGRGLPVSLFDTATGSVHSTSPGDVAGLYVCGITPYDATHMGHAATYLAFDLLVRAWRDGGHAMRYVQNVTDVDDPLLERAEATGEDWRDLAKRQTALFAEDMAALRVVPPDVYLGAVETIPWVVDGVTSLLHMGAAYRVPGEGDEPDGDVYFDVTSDPRFGSVSHFSEPQMLALFGERGGDPDRPGKRNRLDPLLWRVERPGEPSWDGGELGPGRPGWHMECAAIALRELPQPFDVQGGGSDLVFPHHEMGASHASVLTGSWPYARLYAHAGMVGLDGEKMSKSKGNLVLVSRLRADGVDPMAIRLAVLAHHYRTDWPWTDDVLVTAQQRLERWRRAVSAGRGPDGAEVLSGVRACLADDLDAPGAVAVIDAWADEASTAAGGDGRAGSTAAGGDGRADSTAAGGDDAGGDEAPPRLVADVADALLGVKL
ncbi:MAG: cysteine--1-D-myo-inosityl 2-amino-2-deoxy-alpha-D-glucopyranoside ligase [Actinomycetes bacterium]